MHLIHAEYASSILLDNFLTLKASTNFAMSFYIYDKNKVWYLERTVQQTILMKYHALLLFLRKLHNLKMFSAADYSWRFKDKG